ncbi:hypothetical protein N018_12310 [Pseudomonas syringae CC1557]|uniref:Uncharacterized protein n=1 Tax=Pseudomonas syringae CC1557 TaxID=1357279 RepID=W0N3E8_PSESX|nr:hypothetical protein [Xanthomonas translucens]AHG43576.1 hypothetical protein N018_12310 [Pseudomonas syringae CC1557]
MALQQAVGSKKMTSRRTRFSAHCRQEKDLMSGWQGQASDTKWRLR